MIIGNVNDSKADRFFEAQKILKEQKLPSMGNNGVLCGTIRRSST
jgi:hypothetical protein